MLLVSLSPPMPRVLRWRLSRQYAEGGEAVVGSEAVEGSETAERTSSDGEVCRGEVACNKGSTHVQLYQ